MSCLYAWSLFEKSLSFHFVIKGIKIKFLYTERGKKKKREKSKNKLEVVIKQSQENGFFSGNQQFIMRAKQMTGC